MGVTLSADGNTAFVADKESGLQIIDLGHRQHFSSASETVSIEVVDTTPPTFVSAATNSDGTKVVLTYDKLLSGTTASIADFFIKTNGSANPVTDIVISGSTIELSVTDIIREQDTITVSHSDPSEQGDTNAIKDVAGNNSLSLNNQPVGNNSIVERSNLSSLTLVVYPSSKEIGFIGSSIIEPVANEDLMFDPKASYENIETHNIQNYTSDYQFWLYPNDDILDSSGNNFSELNLLIYPDNQFLEHKSYLDIFFVSSQATDLTGNGRWSYEGKGGQHEEQFKHVIEERWKDSNSFLNSNGNNNDPINIRIYESPEISAATYNGKDRTLTIEGVNFWPKTSVKDIDVSKFTITGEGNETYTLTSEDVELTSLTEFTINLNDTDQAKLEQLLNQQGSNPGEGSTYNIAVADDWATGADSADDISDMTGNPLIVVDTFAPQFDSAAVSSDGSKIILTYNESLSSTTSATSAFAVTTDGSTNTVSAVAIDGSTVELTLNATVQNDQTVTVAYTDPSSSNDANAVQDSAGNDAVSLTSTSVTNNSTVAGTAPTFSSAATSTDGTTVVLTYNEALFSTTAAASAFAVTTDGSPNTVTAVAIEGSTVELTLNDTVQNDQTVTVAYTDPTTGNDASAVQDSAGNDAVSLTSSAVTNNSTVAGTAPTFSSAATNTAGTKVVLTYNEPLSSTTAAASAFAVTTDGSPNTVTAVAIVGSTVELTLTNTVKNDQTVTVAYTDPTSSNDTNAVQDSAGNDAVSLTSTSVTNNSTVAGTAPTFSSAATSTDGTKLVLTYNEALSSTTAATSAFAVTTDGTTNTVTAVAIVGSTVELTLTNTVKNDQTVTVAYTDPTSSNDTNAVQDSAGNDAVSLTSTSVTNNTSDNNAPPVLSTPTAGSITETADSSVTTTSGLSGTLSASDANSGDTLTYGITGGSVDNGVSTLAGSYGSLALNTSSGAYSYTPNNSSIEALCAGAISDSFTLSVSDGSDTATAPYIVNITGADDAAVISGTTSGSGAEDSTIAGKLIATDVEGLTDNTYFTVSSNPNNGNASINAETGTWSYTPTANFNGSDAFTVTITDDCDGTTTQDIDLTITAVDDPAVVTDDSDLTGSVTENSSNDTVTGTVDITDVDANQPPRFSDVALTPTANGYGSYFVSSSHQNTAGTWSYTLNNANDTVDALGTGETLTDSFTLTATDGSTQAITITINGAGEVTDADADGTDGSDEVAGIDVHRFYNQTNGAHFYTSSTAEKDNIIANFGSQYRYEGIAYEAPSSGDTALYRFFNRDQNSHFYTASKSEADFLIGKPEWGYEYEGRTFEVSTTPQGDQTEVHRFYNPERDVHFYTASESEANGIIAKSIGNNYNLANARGVFNLMDDGWGYVYEGVAWYVDNDPAAI